MDGQVVIGATLETKSFDAQITQLENKLARLERTASAENKIPEEFRMSAEEARELNVEIEKTRNQLASLYQKQAQLNKTDMSGITNSLQKAGNSIEGIIKKTIRWGLAIFGIRSAYMFIRQEMGVLSQYNETIGADLEYMRWAIANALKPVIEKIIQLAYKALVYIGYILKELFGINIFANASASAFERQKEALSGSNKEAKKLQKTLAGFDEMNIIQETGATSRGGGGGGVALPSQDLEDMMKNIKIPQWLKDLTDWLKKLKKFIQENWDWLWKLGALLAVVFAASKISGWVSNIATLIGVGGTKAAAGSGLLGLGVATAIVAGELAVLAYQSKQVYDAYKDLDGQIKNMAKPSQKAIKIEEELAEKSKDHATSQEDLNNLFSHYTNLINSNRSAIKRNTKELKEMDFWDNATSTVLGILGSKDGVFYQYTDAIAKNSSELKNNIQKLEDMRKAGTLTDEQKKKSIEILKSTIEELQKQKDGLVKNSEEYNKVETAIKAAKSTLEKFKNETTDTSETTSKNMNDVKNAFHEATNKVKDFMGIKIDDKEVKIKATADVSSAEQGLTGWVKRFADKIQSAFNNINFSSLGNKIANGLSKLFPVFGLTKIKSVFGLAKGGIVNLPGKGVPVGPVVTGEVSREGVIPLTDSQQMSMLGEAIGKYITIELTNVTQLDGRQIARKVDKIQQNNNFVLNR